MATHREWPASTVLAQRQAGRVGLSPQHLSPSGHAVSHDVVHAGVLH
jgi:hypothetical protein